jgi:LmbE family N-acetylglucosaminyl deacetylase
VEASVPEGWETPKLILVILAHPDDPEFFCGATVARWTQMGHTVRYALFTRGERGGNGRWVDPQILIRTREAEQKAAAAVLGVHEISYLDYPDGYLQPSLDARRDVVRLIRRVRPNVVVTCDPTNLFHRKNRINHPDHLAAGKIVLEAVYPASGNALFFPELLDEGFTAHPVEEVWVSLTGEGDTNLDVTAQWELKIQALHEHRSQIDDLDAFDRMMRGRHTPDSSPEHPHYVESFRRIIFGM